MKLAKLVYLIGFFTLLILLINYFSTFRLICVLGYFIFGMLTFNNPRMMSLFYLVSLIFSLYLSFNTDIPILMLVISLLFSIGLLSSLVNIDEKKQKKDVQTKI